MKRTIIVVDDSPSITMAVKTGLEEARDDFEVIIAESGEQCINILREITPDAILLDLMMPGLSGWETYDMIKKNEEWANLPILFLTARTDDFAKRSCLFLGDDFIEKPFEINDLANRIEIAIDRVQNQN